MKYSAAQRTAMLDEFERSGLSGAAFALRVGVHYQTFAAWTQKRRLAQGGYQMRAANVATPHSSRAPVRLLEAVAEEVDPHIAARMAAALQARCSVWNCVVANARWSAERGWLSSIYAVKIYTRLTS